MITAVICCLVSIVTTAIVTFIISARYHKRKYSKKITVKQPIANQTDVMEYEEIRKTSSYNVAMTTNPSYDVSMTSNPAYGHNVKKNDKQPHYYN